MKGVRPINQTLQPELLSFDMDYCRNAKTKSLYDYFNYLIQGAVVNKPDQRLIFPENFTLTSANRLLKQIQSMDYNENIIIDFGRGSTIPPRCMLYLYPSLKQLLTNTDPDRVTLVNTEGNNYAGHLGFFQLIGINYGRKPNTAPTTINYIPLQTVQTSTWLTDLGYEGLSAHIDRKCLEFTSILCREMSDEDQRIIHFNLREIIRNVFEHSESETISFVGQCWTKLRKAEIAILDNGIGLKATTTRNTIMPILSDQEAIDAAILPGLTGSSRLRHGDDWDNSGYGLYMTSEIARHLGRFTIASGSVSKELTCKTAQSVDTNLNGTFVSIELSLTDDSITSAFLSDILERGVKISKERFGNKSRRPSAASKGS